MSSHDSAATADVIVVGAGPAGSTTAYYLAQAGLDVLLLEKTAFPREKVCGDGLTPRAVKQLIDMGVDISAENGWIRNKGLRIVGGGHSIEIPWPQLSTYPDFGLVRTRKDFDQALAEHAVAAGARLLERTSVIGPIMDESTGRIVGVRAQVKNEDGTAGPQKAFHAPLVVAADGNSSRLSLAMGLQKRDDRPMGVAVRTYYTSPRTNDDWLESWLELWDGDKLLPGYGWIFGVGDGTVNVGLGILNTSSAFGNVDYKDLLTRWLEQTPQEWGFREANRTEPIRGAALPMGFNRTPHYTRGLLLVGDAGGMVNPFNGEGIAYAMESAAIAARTIVQAHSRPTTAQAEMALASYPEQMKQALGGYYTLGRWFVKAIGNPEIMRLATKHGLPHPRAMTLTLKMLANLTDPRGGDFYDHVVNTMSRMAPTA
ncbi:unannotated protein [freshwater metagenome]|uniref:Unannotated protein n=1 Tax=freshwater metagenome TaxID=449393 RepID=A0A6J7D235_9ZZZZ|nr:geranylgeranyl reductase family protein [Actinomycetota bacterium]